MSDTSRPISTNDAFCELLKLAIDRAPDPEAKATIQSLLLTHCSGVTAQGDSGGTTPPGRGK